MLILLLGILDLIVFQIFSSLKHVSTSFATRLFKKILLLHWSLDHINNFAQVI